MAAERYPGALPWPYDHIMKVHGFDALYDFSLYLGGDTKYVPMPRSLFGNCVAQAIKKEYDGTNARELSITYGYTIKHILNLAAR